MKVRVDSNMTIYGVFRPPMEIELRRPHATLKELLENLSDRCQSVEFIRGNEIGGDIQAVLVNQVEHHNLNAKLSEGDNIMIMVEMAPLGGG